jgi:hypothetical protein
MLKLKLFLWAMVSTFMLLAPFGLRHATASQAAATPILTYPPGINTWLISSGFIYLTDTSTYIRRRATNGTEMSLLASTTSSPQYATYGHAVVDESGIYYYNRNSGRIEAIYSDKPNDPPTPLATIGDFGTGSDKISNLRVYGSSVYWIESVWQGEFDPDDIEIKRVSKLGGTVKTMISYSSSSLASPDGLGITSSYIWWTDRDGLNRINACITQLCVPGNPTKTIEYPVISGDGHIQISGSNVTWWNGNDNPETIRRTTCSRFGGNCSTSTVHSASSSTQIIGMAVNSSAVYWVESVTFTGIRLRRKLFSGGVAETLIENVNGRKPYLDNNFVYFQTSNTTISRLSLSATAITREIAINGWEVTQGIQSPLNDVPLVAGKTTFVRLYPKLENGTEAGSLGAELHGSRDGQPLPGSPIYPLNITIPVSDNLSLQHRMITNGGLLFRLPESWTRKDTGLIPQLDASTHLRAVIDPFGIYVDSDNQANNTIEGDFQFTAKAPTCMRMRPVTTHESYQPVYGQNISQVLALSESILPTSHLITFPSNNPLREIHWCWKGIFYGPFCSTPYELSDDAEVMLAKMVVLDYFAGSPSICLTNNARSLYAGIVHKDANWGTTSGMALLDWDSLVTKVPKYGDAIIASRSLPMTMPHEIAHNYDRKHVDCGGPDDPDNNYPYPPCLLDDDSYSLDSPELHFGFDPLRQIPYNPLTTVDFMTYRDPSWISDYSFKAIFNNTSDPIYVPPLSATALPTGNSSGDLLRISGLINTVSTFASLDYAWALPLAAATDKQKSLITHPNPSLNSISTNVDYHVQLISGNQQVLSDTPVVLSSIGDATGDRLPFELVVVTPSTAVDYFQLMQGDTVLATRDPGNAEPDISIIQPVSGTVVADKLMINWTASDNDGDLLLFTIQYSHNGGTTWVPLLVNYGGTGADEQSVMLDLSSEPGSDGQNALIRILASDGYNTSVDTSASFSVDQRSPFVVVSQPADDQLFKAGDWVTLRGDASDPEDGLIANNQFAWSTGHIGQIADLKGLAPGIHEVDLMVTDSDGLQGDTSVSFEVAPLPVPESGVSFSLDGRCDDPAYQDAPLLPLSAYADGTRAGVKIVHTGGQLWVCFSGLQNTNGYAGLLLDANNSRNLLVQNGDFGFFIKADGTRFIVEGNGSGFVSAPADNLSARIFAHGSVWSAELAIRKSAIGSWQQRVSLALGHFGQNGGVDDSWPQSTNEVSPQSWALSNFGLSGSLTGIEPQFSTLGDGDIALTVNGENFDSDNSILWNGSAMPTTLVDSTTLTTTIIEAESNNAGTYQVSVGVNSVPELTTSALPFNIENPQASITSLTPNQLILSSAGVTLLVNGTDFVDGATVVWNGEQRITKFVNSQKLSIDLSDSDLEKNGAIPVVVINPEPVASASNSVFFTIRLAEEGVFHDGFEQ